MQKQSVSKAKIKLAKHRAKAVVKSRRPLHRKFMLHPATFLVLLSAGVLLLGWTWHGLADDYTVHAVIPASILTEPATITSPVNGQHFTSKPITVQGNCPYPSYIKLYRDGSFSGSTLCTAAGLFNLQTDLAEGANSLQAHIFNITDEEGPLSSAITVYYDLPKIPNNPVPKPLTPQLFLSSDYTYRGYQPGETVSWQIKVIGGVGPYAFNVKWGDKSESNYVQLDNKDVLLQHIYKKAGTYSLSVTGADGGGSSAFLQLKTLVVDNKHGLNGATAGSTIPPTSSANTSNRNLFWLLWPSYLILLLMVFSFWLGEREEIYQIHKAYARRLRHS